MAIDYDEASSQATAPGQVFETAEETRDGITNRVFVNAPKTLAEVFAPSRGAEETFIVYEDERWSFADVMKRVDALADALVHHFGISKGDRVGIAMRNLPEWIVSFAAITSIGAVSVSLNGWWTEDEIDFAVGDSKLSLLIVDPERLARAHHRTAERGIPILVARADRIEPLPDGVEHFDQVLTSGASMPQVAVLPEDDATILYTSGTTGLPKGAVSDHRAVTQALFGFWSSVAIESLRKDAGTVEPAANPPCFILVVPLFHVTGCVPVMLSCFGMRLKLVMMHRWDPSTALRLIEAEEVTTFVGVPTQSWDLLESDDFASYDTSSLTSVGGGGAPAPVKLVQRVEGTFRRGRPGIGYGMTETNGYGPSNQADDYVAHPTATGHGRTPIMDTEIRDETGSVVPLGERGEIWMKAPCVIRRYWNQPDETAETIEDGWLRSGDIGRLDDEGFLYIEDRAKDMVLRAGENVYSAEVESAIYDSSDVYEAAVFGVPHDRLGEEVACVIHRKAGATMTAESLREELSTRLAGFKIPTRIAFSDERLPRNPSGKILKRELRETYFVG